MPSFLVGAALAAASPLHCSPLPGTAAGSLRDATWIVVGEPHGTNEVPDAFADLVCGLRGGRSVVVAVEQPIAEQPAIDAFMRSDGGAAARAEFLRSPIWTGSFKDGRSSKATLRLFERLRALFRARRIVGVVAFQPVEADGAEDFERRMAEILRSAGRRGRVVALVGDVHALRRTVSFGGPAYRPMAAWLPVSRTITLAARPNGGRQWACMSPTDCGSRPLEPGEGGRRRVELGRDGRADYSGVLAVGVPATASPPAVGS